MRSTRRWKSPSIAQLMVDSTKRFNNLVQGHISKQKYHNNDNNQQFTVRRP